MRFNNMMRLSHPGADGTRPSFFSRVLTDAEESRRFTYEYSDYFRYRHYVFVGKVVAAQLVPNTPFIAIVKNAQNRENKRIGLIEFVQSDGVFGPIAIEVSHLHIVSLGVSTEGHLICAGIDASDAIWITQYVIPSDLSKKSEMVCLKRDRIG